MPDEGARPLLGLDHELCPDGETWQVRAVFGQHAAKPYRCPGCDHLVAPGTPHRVAWPAGRSDERRHWHTACWEARERRR